ncbi:MAG: hypothetical protein Kow0029_19790 [Candidatus Rifleibacteriota bacterium]
MFGRSWEHYGHQMLFNQYIDAIRYNKKVGDVKLMFQTVYDRHVGNYKDNAATDYHNVWNLGLGTKYRDNELYLNFYTQDDPALWNRRILHPVTGATVGFPGFANPAGGLTAADDGLFTDDNRYDIEFGSRGPIGKNGHWSYDLGFVYTDYSADVCNLNAATNWKQPEMQGWMGHIAANWDSKKEWAAKLSYTFADDEAVGAYAITNDARYVDASETPYEDIGRGNAYFRNGLMNMYDLKLQAEYRPRDSKHYFRIAGDWLDEMDDTVSNDFARYAQGRGDLAAAPTLVAAGSTKNNTAYDRWNNFMIDDAKAFVLTFEYRYQLAENTRIRVGYTAFDFMGDAQKAGWTNGVANPAQASISAGRGLMNDYDYNQFWAEIYSTF